LQGQLLGEVGVKARRIKSVFQIVDGWKGIWEVLEKGESVSCTKAGEFT
jgi:hypothetical protein